MGFELNKKEVQILFKEIDKDGNNAIDIDELMNFLTLNDSTIGSIAS